MRELYDEKGCYCSIEWTPRDDKSFSGEGPCPPATFADRDYCRDERGRFAPCGTGQTPPGNATEPPHVEEYDGYTKEGGSPSWRNNNPGNIEFGHTAITLGAIGKAAGKHGFAKFPSEEAGMKALQTHLANKGHLTVESYMEKHAPKGDHNDLPKYLNFLKSKGIEIDKPIRGQIVPLSKAIKQFEGWKEGVIKKK
jgi:hypothetical protein